MIYLQCPRCDHQVTRKETDTYTGHNYEVDVQVLCPECNGVMVDMSHRVGAVCACDVALKDIEVGMRQVLPWIYPGGGI